MFELFLAVASYCVTVLVDKLRCRCRSKSKDPVQQQCHPGPGVMQVGLWLATWATSFQRAGSVATETLRACCNKTISPSRVRRSGRNVERRRFQRSLRPRSSSSDLKPATAFVVPFTTLRLGCAVPRNSWPRSSTWSAWPRRACVSEPFLSATPGFHLGSVHVHLPLRWPSPRKPENTMPFFSNARIIYPASCATFRLLLPLKFAWPW